VLEKDLARGYLAESWGKTKKPPKNTATIFFLDVVNAVRVELGENESEIASNLGACVEFDRDRRKVGVKT
jgi:hypothetical protein